MYLGCLIILRGWFMSGYVAKASFVTAQYGERFVTWISLVCASMFKFRVSRLNTLAI